MRYGHQAAMDWASYMSSIGSSCPVEPVILQALADKYCVSMTVHTVSGHQHHITPFPPKLSDCCLHLGLAGQQLVVMHGEELYYNFSSKGRMH